MNSNRYNADIDTIFINFKKSKTCNSHRQILNLSDKMNLKRSDKYVALSHLKQ